MRRILSVTMLLVAAACVHSTNVPVKTVPAVSGRPVNDSVLYRDIAQAVRSLDSLRHDFKGMTKLRPDTTTAELSAQRTHPVRSSQR
jgi:hypothetical protein